MATLNPPIRDWRGQVVWLLGASSGIGAATARALHAQGARVIVSARNAHALEQMAEAHPGLEALPCDVTDAAALASAVQTIVARHGGVDLAVYCAGHYAPQRATAFNLAEAVRHNDVNYLGALRWLDALLPQLLRQRHGHLSMISSVAGFRGLPNSLAYGPTKAALINLAETLWLDLRDSGVAVSVINPGFVDTPLTAQNGFRMPALLTPDEAAQEILRGWQRGQFEVHFPRRFTRWLKAMRLLPYPAYFRATRQITGL